MSCCRGQNLLEGDCAVAIAGSVYCHDKPNPLTARQHCSEVNFILNVFFVMCVYTRVSQCLVTVNMLLFQSNVFFQMSQTSADAAFRIRVDS